MVIQLCKQKQLNIILLALTISLFTLGCSGSDKSSTVGGGGADFDPNLYYTKTDIDNNFASIDSVKKWVSPGGSLTGTITGIKSITYGWNTYASTGCKPDVWSSTANIVLAIVMPSDPTKLPSSDVTIKGGSSETNSQSYVFPANFMGAQVYIFPKDVAGDFRIWASTWNTNTNGTVFSVYTIAFTSQF